MGLNFVVAALSALVVGAVLFAGWAIYDDATSEKLVLRRDAFTCTASHHQLVGKVLVRKCDRYERNR